ncbi:type III PLP-dependent enzyme [Chloroflexota bacterium]
MVLMNSNKTQSLKKAMAVSTSRFTPILVIDKEILKKKFEEFNTTFPYANIYYAIKANPDIAIINFMSSLGAGFEVGSEGSLRLLLDLGISPSMIISGNPLKPISFIKHAHSIGISQMTLDSSAEIYKLANFAPGSEIHVRISVPNNYSEWPLDKKYGVDTGMAVDLLLEAKEYGLNPIGITFHVGSQCTSPIAWTEALKQCGQVWESASNRGLELSSLNLEGGFPAEYCKSVPPLGDFGFAIVKTLETTFPPGLKITLEPGRGLVGEAGVLVSSVIAKAKRDGHDWIYLDVGIFNGLMESIGGIRYPLVVNKKGKLTRYVIAGPSCDSMDALPGKFELPELEIGDHVFIMSAGAYTTAYASQFDGITVPEVLLI